ncbi:alpha/beta hydrolase [Winogradskya consettensis]|uniref:Alpha/beta hydrolase n=1 Tax=Winogradskya consettensis TaxID=113560 RepID=A0A919SBK7_9ACTN|nr:alpha/beta hydrolase [Actinoplanes consettensis]GIM68690.1 alpha/beta hydrolase [Actinoplanes consettensis]
MPTIQSRDGTPISVTTTGTGPGLVVIPGGLRMAHHYTRFAAALAEVRTVHLVDRRGRGDSGPQGPAYSMDREVEDAAAVLDATGAAEVFGHSYGGLVALRLALGRRLDRLVIYEAGLNLDGRINPGILSGMERKLAAGREAAAMTTFIGGLGLAPMGLLPMPVFTAVAWLMLHTADGRETRALLATLPSELREVLALNSGGGEYAAITAPTLIIAGGRSPRWLREVQSELAALIPGSAHTVSPGLNHNAPDENAPAEVADLVRAFLTTGGARAR